MNVMVFNTMFNTLFNYIGNNNNLPVEKNPNLLASISMDVHKRAKSWQEDTMQVESDMIEIATKQGFVLAIDCIFVFIYTVLVLAETIDVKNDWDVVSSIANCIQVLATGVTIWLTFEFAEKQYEMGLGKCDEKLMECCRDLAIDRLASQTHGSRYTSLMS